MTEFELDMKECPNCYAMIYKGDTLCIHCGHRFEEADDEE